MVTENEQKLMDILTGIKAGKVVPEVLAATEGTNSRGKTCIVTGKWRVQGLLFEYTVEDGRKYGTATVSTEGSDIAFDLLGCNGLLRDIVYQLRFPKAPRASKPKAAPKEEVA